MMKADTCFNLEGKVALITGASRGIGAACARTLAAAGPRVMVTDILEGPARKLVEEIGEDGGQADFVALDVTDESQWECAIRNTTDRLAGLDVLVNNAGIEIMKPIAETTLEEWRRAQGINVEGVFLGVKHGIRAMMPGGPAGRGRSIINMSSVAGLVGFPGVSAYSASKGAVRMLTKCAALECAQAGLKIRVNSVHPGVVRTAMAESLEQELVKLGMTATREDAAGFIDSLHPMGTLGEPLDIARVVHFLASDAAGWVTGAEYVVDGGFTAH